MKTSCFALYKGPGRVAISIGRPRGISRAEYEVYAPLAPQRSWLKLPYEEYLPLYRERLAALDAQRVWDELHALVPAEEPVLLCFEEPPLTADNWCHRQIVAQWFREELGRELCEVGVGPVPPPPQMAAKQPDCSFKSQRRLMDHEGYVSPSSRALTDPVSLEELQEQGERLYAALDALWRAHGRQDALALEAADKEVRSARRQVRAGWRRMSEVERALAVQRRMIPASIISDL